MNGNLAAARDRAAALDRDDPLAPLRERFHIPADPSTGEPVAYLAGNSLGLMPKAAATLVDAELDLWRRRGVHGHFEGEAPWVSYHETVREPLARLVGARPAEVSAMNGLTVNLHVLMTTFYRPTPKRHAILIEEGAFPSDRYACASQMRMRRYDPQDALLTPPLRPGEATHREDDLLAFIERNRRRLALVLLGGVSYRTGQAFPLARVVEVAHKHKITVGFDLAHAAGNLDLRLHDWGVDFAAWCSYKYLNSGPGGTAAIFVHERFHGRDDLPRLAGWWGHDPATRFAMPDRFQPQAGADAWQLSNCPILGTAPLRAALAAFEEAGFMGPLRAKSERLTGFLDEMVSPIPGVELLTPRDPAARGCQLSLRVRSGPPARTILEGLEARGVVCDVREPGIIRVAPVPLYNRFDDAWRFAAALAEVLGQGAAPPAEPAAS